MTREEAIRKHRRCRNSAANSGTAGEGGKRMKYIIELEKIEGTDLYRAVGANTLVFDERGIENILKPLPKPETDWSKVKLDTPMLFSDDGVVWRKAHFAKYDDNKVYVWMGGRTSYTAYEAVLRCKYAKLEETEK